MLRISGMTGRNVVPAERWREAGSVGVEIPDNASHFRDEGARGAILALAGARAGSVGVEIPDNAARFRDDVARGAVPGRLAPPGMTILRVRRRR